MVSLLVAHSLEFQDKWLATKCEDPQAAEQPPKGEVTID